jgi:hypothetical protein
MAQAMVWPPRLRAPRARDQPPSPPPEHLVIAPLTPTGQKLSTCDAYRHVYADS